MSEAAATTPPAATSDRPLGNQRGVGITIVLAIVTLGIYVIVWQWKTFNEIRNYRGKGVGGFAGFLLSFVFNIPIWLLPSYVGKLYQEDGERAPITGWSGFWAFIPFGMFVWLAKIQGALNDFWVSKGQPRK